MQNKYAMFVLISVKHVLKNVKDIQICTIVSSVHRYVEDVQKNVVKCDRPKKQMLKPYTSFLTTTAAEAITN
jgi:hypothetical protein